MKLPFLFLAAAHSAAALPGPPKNVTTKPTTPHTSGNETTNASNGTAGRDKTFSLSQIPNPNYQQPDALSALVWVYAKHGQELPQQLKTAVETSPMLNSKFNPLLKGGHLSLSRFMWPGSANSIQHQTARQAPCLHIQPPSIANMRCRWPWEPLRSIYTWTSIRVPPICKFHCLV